MSSEPASSDLPGGRPRPPLTRDAILDALRRFRPVAGEVDPGGMTSGQLAELLGVHPTTVRFHTDRLEVAGLIRSHLSTAFGVGRPRKVFAAAPVVVEADRSTYLMRLLELMTESFNTGVTPVEAGEQWAHRHLTLVPAAPATSPGAWLSKVGPLVDVLQDWGYAPDLTTTDVGRTCRITLNDCPFRELARAHPDVVCGIHCGLVRGALHQVGEDDVDLAVQPFVAPDRCLVTITTRQRFDDHEEPAS